MAEKIVVRVDRVYGKVVVYPVCEKAKLLAQIAGTSTLTHKTLSLAERMGFEIVRASAAVVSIDPPGYAERVRELELEGLTTSDAQACADVEFNVVAARRVA